MSHLQELTSIIINYIDFRTPNLLIETTINKRSQIESAKRDIVFEIIEDGILSTIYVDRICRFFTEQYTFKHATIHFQCYSDGYPRSDYSITVYIYARGDKVVYSSDVPHLASFFRAVIDHLYKNYWDIFKLKHKY